MTPLRRRSADRPLDVLPGVDLALWVYVLLSLGLLGALAVGVTALLPD